MATTYSQTHYANKTKTAGNPTDLWDLLQTTQAVDSTTAITFTSTTQAFVRIAPYRLNQSGTSYPAIGAAASNVGWKIPVSVMNASSGEPRVIRAGQYSMPMSMTTGTYALLAASPSYQMWAALYQINAAGVSTEIGRGTTTLTVAQTTTQVFNVVFTLATDLYIPNGETLQVEWILRGNATANTLGTVTNNACVFNMGAQSNFTPPTAIRTEASRSASDAAAAPADTTLRVQVDVRRTTDAVAVPTDSTARSVTARRSPSEANTVADSAPFTATYPRAISETAPAMMDDTSRVQSDYRRASDTGSLPTTDASRRVLDVRRAAQQVDATIDSAQKLVVYGRTARHDFVPGDSPLIDPTRSITGVIRDSSGNPYLGSATVYLVRDDNLVAASTLSDPTDGTYKFRRNSYDTSSYYVVAFTDGALPREGVTERGLIPT